MTQRLAGTITNASVGDSDDDGELPIPDSETVSVTLDDDPADPMSPGKPRESVNMVEYFRDDELAKMSARVLEDYDDDVESRSEHMKQLKRWYELYASVKRVKNWPFQNCANINEPLLTYSVLQVHGRLFDMLIPAKGNIFNSDPTRIDDDSEVDRAERTETYFNWYLREKIPDFRMSMDDTLWQLVIFGSTFRHSYWDETEGRICSEWIGVEDMVVPYSCKVTDPTMRGVPRYTLVRNFTMPDIEEKMDSGEFDDSNRSKLRPGTGKSSDKDSEFKEIVDRVDGKDKQPSRFLDDDDRKVLYQHRKLRLPNDTGRHESFDGKYHPVIVTLDADTGVILRVVLREEDDPKDAKRYQQEKQKHDQAKQALEAHAATGGMMPDPMTGQLAPVPAPPDPGEEPKKPRKREVFFFTHYKCFPSEGFYGLGFGAFVGPLNEAANTLINQQIDRATVNNAGGGLISRQVRFQRGPINRQPGEFTEVDAPPAAMKDGLIPWPQVNPDPEGRWFIEHIEQMANRTAGTGDTLSGEPVGANETARAAMARYEQAQKQISILAARIIGYLTCDARIMWRLLSVYLDATEYENVVDSAGKPRQIPIGPDDFVADARVTPTADARLTSHAQRLGEAMDFFQFVCNPQGPPELVQNGALRRKAIERVLIAMDAHDTIELLGPPPGPPQPPPPQPQWQENAAFLNDQDAQVNQADDDDEHLLELHHFKMDPLGYQKLSPTGKKMADNHERAHFAAKMVKERQADEQRKQASAALRGPVGGGPPRLAPAAPNGPPGGLPALGPVGRPS